jgi:hypothetical protein
MIPWECRHSIAREISSAKPMATCVSKHLGRMLSKYLRRVPPDNSSVTITITGSLQAPINCRERAAIFIVCQLMQTWRITSSLCCMIYSFWFNNIYSKHNQILTFTKFLCCTLDNIATSLAKRSSLLAISSVVSPLCTILIATIWFLYLKWIRQQNNLDEWHNSKLKK